MARQLLVVGLKADTTVEHAKQLRDMMRELYPGLEVAVIAGCTDLAVVDLPDADEPEEEAS